MIHHGNYTNSCAMCAVMFVNYLRMSETAATMDQTLPIIDYKNLIEVRLMGDDFTAFSLWTFQYFYILLPSELRSCI